MILLIKINIDIISRRTDKRKAIFFRQIRLSIIQKKEKHGDQNSPQCISRPM